MNKRYQSRSAFTLVEVLLVLLIIGMLAGVLVVTIGGSQTKAEIETTRAKLLKLESKIQEYKMHIGHFPTESEGGLQALIQKPNFEDEKTAEKWLEPFVKSVQLVDAWGNAFNYEPPTGEQVAPGVHFKLWSNGPDGQANTADDIKNYDESSEG